MDEENLFQSIKNSFGESSQYSDACDDYDQVIKVNDIQNSDINKNNIINNEKKSFKETNINNINKDTIPIPEDNSEKPKSFIYRTIKEVDEENINNSININNNDSININNNNSININNNNSLNLNNNNSLNLNNNNNSININNSFNINNNNNSINLNNNNDSINVNNNNSINLNNNNDSINVNNNNSINLNLNNNNNSINLNNNNSIIKNDNNNINNSIKYDEDLYSIRYDSKNNSKIKDSDDEDEVRNSDIMKIKKITFDNNLEPLDNNVDEDNSNININLNINSINKEKNNVINKQYKRFNTDIDKIKKKSSFGKFNYDRANTNTSNIGSQNSRKKNHTYFDLKNILKKAVILNGKKGKNIKSSLFRNNNDDSFLSNKFNDSRNSLFNNPYQINNIRFNNIKIDDLSTHHLKKHLRVINVESENKNKNNNFFNTLIELQNFYIDDSSVWVVKISEDGKYLAGGCKSGKIKIYEVIGYNYSKFKTNYEKKNILEYLNFINETPYKTLERHKSDIIDLSWSPFYPNLLLSASFDRFVYLWDINQEENNCLLDQYEHSDIVTSVSFNPNIRNMFISGGLDSYVRIWKFDYYDNIINTFDDNYNNINSENNQKNNSFEKNEETNAYLEQENQLDKDSYFNIDHKITSLSYFPDGSKICVGTEKGRIYVYNTFPKINYNNNFFCSNKKFGIFHGGKKVTNIQFIDKLHAIISTSDSYIRLVDMHAGRILYNYKGYVNKNSMTRSYTDLSDNVIIVGSEDGYCYLWNLFDTSNKKNKNKNYERYKPFSKEIIECSIIANEKCYVNYMQKFLKLTNKVLITSIIINGTSKGRLEILLNIKES